MGLSIQMGIKRNILFIRFNGELDHMTCESLKIRTCEILEKYYIKHLILNFEKLSLWIVAASVILLGGSRN